MNLRPVARYQSCGSRPGKDKWEWSKKLTTLSNACHDDLAATFAVGRLEHEAHSFSEAVLLWA